MGRPIKHGSTNVSIDIRIIDSSDGTPEEAVEHSTSGLALWYRRDGAAKTTITPVALASLTTAHTDGGIEHIDDGWYRLDVPDAAFASGVDHVTIGGTCTGMVILSGTHPLVAYDNQDAVRLGLTSLPDAAADAAGGLVISDAGGLDADAMATSVTDIEGDTNELQADLTNGGRLDLLIDNILTDTGTSLVNQINALNDLSTSDIDARLAAIGLDHLVSAATVGADVTDDSIIAQLVSSSATADWDTFDNTTDSLQAIADGGGGPTAGDIADAVLDEALSGHTTAGTLGKAVADIEADTNELQTDLVDGGRLDLIFDATLADTADLQANQGNWLTATGFNTDDAATIADAVWDEAISGHTTAGTTGKYVSDLQTTTAAIKVKTDQFVFTTANQLDVQVLSMATDSLTADAAAADFIGASEIAASASQEIADLIAADWIQGDASPLAIAAAVWDTALASHTTAGTAGKAVADIEADTNELQTDWVDGGRLDLIADAILVDTGTTIPATLTTITGALPDTLSLAAINAEVDTALSDYDPPTNTEMLASFSALNDVSTSEVGTEVDSSLVAIHLDHLFASSYDPDSQPGSATALLNELIVSDSGVSQLSTNALELAPSGGGGSGSISLQSGTITTVTSQTEFILGSGSSDDSAYPVGFAVVITDQTTGTQKAVGRIASYTGSTKTLVLAADPGVFTAVDGDSFDILAVPYLSLPLINAEVDTAITDAALATAAGLAALNNVSTGDVNTQVAAALATFWTSPATLVGLVWNEPQAGYVTSGTFGYNLDAQVSGVASGNGGTALTVTVEDASDSSAIEGAVVTISKSGEGPFVLSTDSNGDTAAFGLNSFTYDYVITAPGFTGATGTFTIPDDAPTQTVQLTANGTVTPAADPAQSTAVMTVYNTSSAAVGEDESTISIYMTAIPDGVGHGFDSGVKTANTDANGVVQFTLWQGATYAVYRGDAPGSGAGTFQTLLGSFTVPAAPTCNIASILGTD